MAEDNAIEDTIYHLHRALVSGRIDLERFLRVSTCIAFSVSPVSLFSLLLCFRKRKNNLDRPKASLWPTHADPAGGQSTPSFVARPENKDPISVACFLLLPRYTGRAQGLRKAGRVSDSELWTSVRPELEIVLPCYNPYHVLFFFIFVFFIRPAFLKERKQP